MGRKYCISLFFSNQFTCISSPRHAMLECISISSSWPSCRTQTPGRLLWTSVTGTPMVSWLSAMPILRFACGHWNPGKTKSHVILSVRSRDFQGTRVSTLLIPPSPPQRPRLSFQAAQHHFLNALGPLKIKEREVSCQQLLLSVQPEAKSEPGFLLTSK